MAKPTSIAEARLTRTIVAVRETGAITTTEGGTTVEGPDGMALMRALSILSGLRLEVRTGGKMKISRGVSCYALAKREFNLRGNRESVLAQLEELYQRAKERAVAR